MKLLFGGLFVLILAGCAATPSPDLAVKQKQVNDTIPTCREAKECEIKWATARQWVLTHSGYKIQNITADYLETYNSVGGSTSLAARVQKLPNPDGSYRIEASFWCDNMFGCVPLSPLDALLNFNQTVNAAAGGVQVRGEQSAQPKTLGVQYVAITKEMAASMNLPTEQGAVVVGVTPGSVAEKAGIQLGDIIQRFDGQPVLTIEDLKALVSKTRQGTKVSLAILRNGAPALLVAQF